MTMTQEQKDLLLQDLCARLPYGVKVQCEDYLFTFDKEHMGIGLLYTDFNGNPLESPKIILSGCYYGEDIKPYLFPLSSMTEEQREEFIEFAAYEQRLEDCGRHQELYYYDLVGHENNFYPNSEAIDWLNAHHFDYRGLIEKGLAINAVGLNIY